MPSTATIETERLLLRPVALEDLDEVVRLHEDPEVARFMGTPDREWLEGWVEGSDGEWAELGYGRMAMLDRDSGAFLGRTGLKRWPQFEETEVGWALRPEARGRGLATEAARAVLGWSGQFDLPYVTAMIRPDNAPSIAVAERLGLSPMREDELLGVPVVVWATRSE
ncbi:MAG: GNAT family N-acetyltransferase [Actinomycetota bacterium]|nr:GNAT family N-acetyltransferase [Actinomycetota bacterium]